MFGSARRAGIRETQEKVSVPVCDKQCAMMILST